MSTVFRILKDTAQRTPEKVALVYKDNSYTYRDLLGRVLKVATYLRGRTKPGDIVSLYMENSDEWIIAYFGILAADRMANPIGLRTSEKNVVYQLQFARSALLITSDMTAQKADRCAGGDVPRVSFKEVSLNVRGTPLPRSAARNNPYALLLYTSGTTSAQKAIRLKHETVLTTTRHIADYLGVTADDRYYQVLPMTHSFGLGNVHVTFWKGGTVVIAENTINYRKMLADMHAHKTTFFAAVPLTLSLIVENYFNDLKKLKDSLHLICTNTGPMPPSVTHRLITEIPRTAFHTYYGLTEASRSTFMHYNRYPDKLASVGKPLTGVSVKIVDEDGHTITEPDTVGEVRVSGSNTVEEYWQNEEATRASFTDGWLHAGDMGKWDADGFLYIVGRSDDMVNIGGEKVSLQVVDDVIRELPFVEDAAAVAVPDLRRDFLLEAHVVLKDRAENDDTKRTILDHCRLRLDTHAVPQAVVFTASIPRTDSGKLKRKALSAGARPYVSSTQ